MFDFPFKEPSIFTSAYCLICYLILLCSNYHDGLKEPFVYEISQRKIVWSLLLIAFLIITHCYSGDFFHFMHHLYNYSSVPGSYNYGEDIYVTIGFFVGKNYFLFRSIVWGGAFCLFCLTAKRMNISVYHAAVLLIATHAITFSYARATAAMAVYFFGLSFLCSPLKNKWLSYIIGAFIMTFSLKFHSSAFIMLFATIMIFIPIKKWTIILVVILLYLFSGIFNEFILDAFIGDNANDVVSYKYESASQRIIEHGPADIIMNTLEYASFYIPFIIATLNIFRYDDLDYIPKGVFYMYKVSVSLVLMSLLFYFLGSLYETLFYRVLFMSMIPITLVISNLNELGILSNRQFRWCILLGIISCFINYLYNIYLVVL